MEKGGQEEKVEMKGGLQGDEDRKGFFSPGRKDARGKGSKAQGTGPGQSCYNPWEDSFASY